MKSTSQFRMADRLAEGNLRTILAEARAAGESYEAIARRLFADFGIEVTRQTLLNWSQMIEAEPAEAAS